MKQFTGSYCLLIYPLFLFLFNHVSLWLFAYTSSIHKRFSMGTCEKTVSLGKNHEPRNVFLYHRVLTHFWFEFYHVSTSSGGIRQGPLPFGTFILDFIYIKHLLKCHTGVIIIFSSYLRVLLHNIYATCYWAKRKF